MKYLKLKDRLVRLQLLSTLLALVFAAVLISFNEYSRYRKNEISNIQTLATVLSRNLSTCLSFQDKEECQRVLNSIKDYEYTAGAFLYDSNVKIVNEYKKTNLDVDVDVDHFLNKRDNGDFQYVIKDNYIYSVLIIKENNVVEGYLYLVLDFNLLKRFGYELIGSMLLIIIVSVFVVFFLSSLLQKEISNMLNIIVETILKIKNTKSYKSRIPIVVTNKSIDEFVTLAESFNEMITEIESRDNSLKEYAVDLENLVEVKVQEISVERAKATQSAQLASLGEMAGGIAHEINNPLTVLIGLSRILIQDFEKDVINHALIREYLLQINKMADRIAIITKGMGNISRNSENEAKSVCTFNDLISDLQSLASQKIRLEKIEMKINASEVDLFAQIFVHRVQLSQVLINLNNNAYDAIVENKYKERWIEISFKIEPHNLVIHIMDSGSGIPSAVIKKMFNPFFTTKEIGKGTGIGLSISKTIIENAGGEFVYDDKCPNTCFIIKLPK